MQDPTLIAHKRGSVDNHSAILSRRSTTYNEHVSVLTHIGAYRKLKVMMKDFFDEKRDAS
jgi:hypothetical protein